MSNYANLPAPTPEGGLSRYLQEIRKFPMLDPQEEYMLAKRWVEEQDTKAAHKMVTSHLRLAAKIAMGYRGYGLPQSEVISEANVGLMQAVKRFDPEKGFVWRPMPCGGSAPAFRNISCAAGLWSKWAQPAPRKNCFSTCAKRNRASAR
jgi:hypothetical protein